MTEEIELTEFPHHKLKCPLKVTIIEIEGHYYASNNELEIYADGNSSDEAFEYFRTLLGEHYNRAKKLVEMVE